MRWLVLVLLISGCADDKLGHFTAGSMTSSFVTEATGDQWKGCLAALGIGIAKEVYDSLTHDPEFADIVATSFGCTPSWTF